MNNALRMNNSIHIWCSHYLGLSKVKKSRTEKPSFGEPRKKMAYDLLKSATSEAGMAGILDVDWTGVNNRAKRFAEVICIMEGTKQKGGQDKHFPEQKRKVKDLGYSGPRKYGLKTDLLTLKRVAQVIQSKFLPDDMDDLKYIDNETMNNEKTN